MTTTPLAQSLVIYVDIDDTLVRSFGSKRIPMTPVVHHVRELKAQGAELYAWSTAGATYARHTAEELGIGECFAAFLPKPHAIVDDQQISDWRRFVEIHPNSCSGMTVKDYQEKIEMRMKRSSP